MPKIIEKKFGRDVIVNEVDRRHCLHSSADAGPAPCASIGCRAGELATAQCGRRPDYGSIVSGGISRRAGCAQLGAHLPANFASTGNALEWLAFAAKDALGNSHSWAFSTCRSSSSSSIGISILQRQHQRHFMSISALSRALEVLHYGVIPFMRTIIPIIRC